MKTSMNDSNSSSDDGNNHHNWLGFSLSPHMKMEVTTCAPSPSSASFYLSHLSPSSHMTAMCYPSVGDNGAASFHSPLTVMPLKSDGSLCIMEALSRSQQTQVMVPTSSPKLEDFLGGASMGSDEYGTQQREAMALSLDSIYYSSQNADSHQVSRDHSLDLLSHPWCHGMYPLEEEQQHKEAQASSLQMPPAHVSTEEGVDCFKKWVEQQQVNCSSVRDDGAELQTLSLSMSPGSQSSCVTVPAQISPSGTDSVAAVMDGKKRGSAKLAGQKQPVHRKSIDTFGQRTSQYRGVTRHRWTGRYEAHLWDNSCKKEGQTRKGRQVYLGGYDMEEKAARAYDLAALKYWGPSTHINFPLENYQAQLDEMKNMTRQEYVAHLRRKSSGFSRGASMYRGVTRHHQHGRWQARIGRVAGNKDLYLGTFSTQEEAAEAYDVAAIKFRGVNAVTNFDISRYDVERIMASNTLLAGEMARRNKEMELPRTAETSQLGNINVETVEARNKCNNETDPNWKKTVLFQQLQQQESNNGCGGQKGLSCGNYRNPAFSVALQDLIGIDSVGSGQPMLEDSSNKINGNGTHFSNPSSLVTSLSSSREGSPDKMGPTMLFPKPPTVAANPITSGGVSSWFPSQMRPASAAAISLSHLPVFAAWNDA